MFVKTSALQELEWQAVIVGSVLVGLVTILAVALLVWRKLRQSSVKKLLDKENEQVCTLYYLTSCDR